MSPLSLKTGDLSSVNSLFYFLIELNDTADNLFSLTSNQTLHNSAVNIHKRYLLNVIIVKRYLHHL